MLVEKYVQIYEGGRVTGVDMKLYLRWWNMDRIYRKKKLKW